ncbi:MAG: hypothetical protein IPG45_34840 [Deltaproteobacteria bacterium]|nr:hypothetical protein [Deltaproteobacteria bacterium]
MPIKTRTISSAPVLPETPGPGRSLLVRLSENRALSRFLKIFAGASIFVNSFGPNRSRPKIDLPLPKPTTKEGRSAAEARLLALNNPTNVVYPGSLLGVGPAKNPAIRAAKERLQARAGDGISAEDLALVGRALEAEFGPEKAGFGLRRAVAERTGQLDEGAITWLQNSHASMGRQVAILEHVLTSHLAKARLIDVNFDGQLNGGDVAWNKGADGRVNVQQISQAMADRVRVGAAVVSACLEMHQAQHEFAIAPRQKFSSEFWRRDGQLSRYATFHLKPGAKASSAMNDVFVNPDAYRFECATALVLVYYRAIQKLIGDSDFDRLMGDLKIGPWEYEADLQRFLMASGRGDQPATEARAQELKFGEYTYTKNWAVSWWGWAKGCQGQNQIRLDEDLYYAHSYALVGQGDIVARENGARVLGAKTSASMTDRQQRLNPQLLAEDQER